MQTQLLKDYESFLSWCATYTGKGIDYSEEAPLSYPCVIVWYQYDISNSMSYGWGIVSEFVYPVVFQEE